MAIDQPSSLPPRSTPPPVGVSETASPLAAHVPARRVLGEGLLAGALFGAGVGGMIFWSERGNGLYGGLLPHLLELLSKTMLTGAIVMTVYAALLLLIERRVGTARHGHLSRAGFRVWFVLPLLLGVCASLYAYFVMVYRPRDAVEFSGAGLIFGALMLVLAFVVQRLLPPRVATPTVSKPVASPWTEED